MMVTRSGRTLGRVRVLLVEDEPRMATLLDRQFREEGYAVDVVADGPDGLWLATENNYAAAETESLVEVRHS
jgi:CheY-like chemotaxis protein